MKQRIEKILRGSGVEYKLLPLPKDISLDLAEHVKFHGIQTKEAVPTLIFKTEKGMIAVQRRADCKLDMKKLKDLVGVKRLGFVEESDLKDLDTKAGEVPMLGMDMPYFTDSKVLELKYAYGGAGNNKVAVRLKPNDLININKSTTGDFTVVDNGSNRKRILTGDTPTGKLHLGHFVGTLENRVKLQNEYETFIILADLHALTTLSRDPKIVAEHTYQVALDNLAVGLDPEKTNIFVESRIPEIYELAAIFSMYVSHARALRNPTVKDEIVMKGMGEHFSLGFINYPIFQAADILCVKAHLVPVGVDQVAHLEQTREIARDINEITGSEIFPIPEALIGRVGKLVGTDGNPKMSKSLGNLISLSEDGESVKKKVMNMYTDPSRIHPTDPGKVEGNPVFSYHDCFNVNKEEVEELKKKYKMGKVGDVEVKEKLLAALNSFLDPIRERRKYYENNRKLVLEILDKGTKKTREETIKTLGEVKEKMGLLV